MVPAPPFAHLARMSDARGIFEHARGAVPRYDCGYCLDDVARALVVVCRERPVTPSLERLATVYFQFVTRAQAPDGTCHNRLDTDGRWQDQPSTGDWWGRALWGLGTAAARSTQPWIRDSAIVRFDLSATQRSRYPHSMAFAALGAAEILTVRPGHRPAVDLLAAMAAMVERPDFGTAWPWPQARLTYANASIPEAMIAAGAALGDDAVLADGLGLLGWLLDTETLDGHLSVTPAGGCGPDEPRPAFDQQPIEVSALADACGSAFRVTGQSSWLTGVDLAWDWFGGDNDSATPMFDPKTGGGYDGLERHGRNLNQGAESTLAMLATAQQARRLSELE